jgi:hypothetical protein
MRATASVLMCLLTALLLSGPAGASRGDISTIIEGFMAKQFPEAKSRFWVVNGTQWQTEEEIVVDVNTVVVIKADQAPTENRYLLLIIGDRLAATQNIPMDAKTDCSPDRT